MYLFSILQAKRVCDFTFNGTDHIPFSMKKTFEKGTRICIDAIYPGLVVVLHEYHNMDMKAIYYDPVARTTTTTEFQDNSKIGVVDFGKYVGLVYGVMRSKSIFSFGAFCFGTGSGYRVVSTYAKDTFKFGQSTNIDEGELQLLPNTPYGFFSTALEEKTVKIDFDLVDGYSNTTSKELLNVFQSDNHYTVNTNTEIKSYAIFAFTINFQSSPTIKELEFDIESSNYEPSRLIRYIGYPNASYANTTSNYSRKTKITTGTIIAIVVSVVFIISVVIIIYVVVKMKQKTDPSLVETFVDDDNEKNELNEDNNEQPAISV